MPALILPVHGISPIIPADCFIADNATIIGDVVLGSKCTVWFTAVIRGDVQARTFIAFYLKDSQVIAADAVNRAAEFMLAKKLVASGVRAGSSELADTSVHLKGHVPG